MTPTPMDSSVATLAVSPHWAIHRRMGERLPVVMMWGRGGMGKGNSLSTATDRVSHQLQGGCCRKWTEKLMHVIMTYFYKNGIDCFEKDRLL